MSKEKMNAAEIVELLSQQVAVSKKLSDDFLKALLATIEEALVSQDSVKINGLGIFKLQWNEPRKSVDVNTGAEIVIDGYHKVVFTPDAELKELANEPYAHLQPVLLDDGEEATEKTSVETADADQMPLKFFNEQASEIKDILSEINALNDKQEDKTQDAAIEVTTTRSSEPATPEVPLEIETPLEMIVSEEAEEKPEEKPDVKPEVVEKEIVESSEVEVIEAPEEVAAVIEDKEAEPVVEESAAKVQEVLIEEPPIKAKQKQKADRDESRKSRIQEADEFHPERLGKSSVTRAPGRKLDFLFVGIMLGGLLVYVLIDFDVFSLIKKYIDSNRFRKEIVQVPQSRFVIPEEIPADNMLTDTTVLQQDTVVQETVAEPTEPVDELQLLFDQPRVYKEFIATEKVIPGSRLTRIAERHYGVKEFWVYIFEANRDLLNSPDDIAVGMQLKIPKLNPKLADADNPRCMEYALKLHDEYVKKK
jgi:nucleoid DNA-binding protein/nucleoid-associated protein YgaU